MDESLGFVREPQLNCALRLENGWKETDLLTYTLQVNPSTTSLCHLGDWGMCVWGWAAMDGTVGALEEEAALDCRLFLC